MFLTIFIKFTLIYFLILLFMHVGKDEQNLVKKFLINNSILMGMLIFHVLFTGIMLLFFPYSVYEYLQKFVPYELGHYFIIYPLFLLIIFYAIYVYKKKYNIWHIIGFTFIVLMESKLLATLTTLVVFLIPEVYYISKGLIVIAGISLITHAIWLSRQNKGTNIKEKEKE